MIAISSNFNDSMHFNWEALKCIFYAYINDDEIRNLRFVISLIQAVITVNTKPTPPPLFCPSLVYIRDILDCTHH